MSAAVAAEGRAYVGVVHDFKDPLYARGWAERFTPTPGRLALFAAMTRLLAVACPPAPIVLELGTGPGYFAEALLEALPAASYVGLDFSQPMLDLAALRLQPHRSRTTLLQLDLLQEHWADRVQGPFAAIVSTWALHDLGGEGATAAIYGACRRLLSTGGLLLNGDFVKPEGTSHDFEPGRFSVARHLELLHWAGFAEARCLGRWEEELQDPTTAQNYACLAARA